MAVTEAEQRARQSIKGDRVLAYRDALEAAKLTELLEVLLPEAGA